MAVRFVETFFFPTTCGYCYVILDGNDEIGICKSCSIEAGNGTLLTQSCVKCAHPMRENICLACEKDLEEHRILKVDNQSIWENAGLIQKILYDYKFRKRKAFSETLTNLVLRSEKSVDILKNVDLLVAVPSNKISIKRRGFGHMERIVHSLSKKTGIPTRRLIKKKNVDGFQHFLDAKSRLENTLKLYSVNSSELAHIKKRKIKTVLIVDDIYTTGATIQTIGEMLLVAGIENVRAFSLCRSVMESPVKYETTLV